MRCGLHPPRLQQPHQHCLVTSPAEDEISTSVLLGGVLNTSRDQTLGPSGCHHGTKDLALRYGAEGSALKTFQMKY